MLAECWLLAVGCCVLSVVACSCLNCEASRCCVPFVDNWLPLRCCLCVVRCVYSLVCWLLSVIYCLLGGSLCSLRVICSLFCAVFCVLFDIVLFCCPDVRLNVSAWFRCVVVVWLCCCCVGVYCLLCLLYDCCLACVSCVVC